MTAQVAALPQISTDILIFNLNHAQNSVTYECMYISGRSTVWTPSMCRLPWNLSNAGGLEGQMLDFRLFVIHGANYLDQTCICLCSRVREVPFSFNYFLIEVQLAWSDRFFSKQSNQIYSCDALIFYSAFGSSSALWLGYSQFTLLWKFFPSGFIWGSLRNLTHQWYKAL
jgi:hypothetical protein